MTSVLCYGAILPDRVLALPRFPLPGEGMRMLDEQLYLGGAACNVGGHLARWGIPVGLAGNNLGDDDLAAFVEARLRERPRTTVVVGRDPGMTTPSCTILRTPDGERTILTMWHPGTTCTLPSAEVVAESRLVSMSIYGIEMDLMLDLALAQRKPLALADVSGRDPERMQGAVIIATSRAVLERHHEVTDVAGWIDHVWHATHALIVVSDGPRTVWARTADGRDLHVTPPRVAVVDTTGAGDALNAALIFGWLEGWSPERSVPVAVAAASASCAQAGPSPLIPLPEG